MLVASGRARLAHARISSAVSPAAVGGGLVAGESGACSQPHLSRPCFSRPCPRGHGVPETGGCDAVERQLRSGTELRARLGGGCLRDPAPARSLRHHRAQRGARRSASGSAPCSPARAGRCPATRCLRACGGDARPISERAKARRYSVSQRESTLIVSFTTSVVCANTRGRSRGSFRNVTCDSTSIRRESGSQSSGSSPPPSR